MDPVTIGVVGVAAAGAISQYLNSEEARKANQQEIAQLHRLLANLQSPNFDQSQITPEQYQVVGKYVPQIAPHIQELNPTVVQKSPAMAQGEDAQRQALQKLQGIASSEQNPELAAMSQRSLQQAQAAAQSRQASLLENFHRRGSLDSGTQLAAQLSGSEGAMGRAADAGQSQAIEAYRQRLGALQGSAQLGGQIRNQDESTQARNAAIINSFNERMANNGQAYANYAAGTANNAQLHNQGLAQGAANANVGERNAAAIRNQQYGNQLKQYQFNNDLQKLGVNTGMSQMQMDQNRQGAQDRNAAIQGVTNAATAGAMSYQGGQSSEDARRHKEKLAFYNKTGQAPGPGDFGYYGEGE